MRSKHAAIKHGVIYIRQAPVARKLQENLCVFSDDRQKTDILQIGKALGSGFRIGREPVHFVLGVGIAPVLVVIEESPESLNPMTIGTELPLLGGPEELVASLGCPGLCLESRGSCMRLVTCQAGNDSLGRRFTTNIEGWHVAGFSGLRAV